MNIIAGQRRGAQLFAPRGMDTRPTQAKVKESVFNIIQAYVPDADVLDLFAGSGSLALEALSRGANHATLVDVDREAIACIRRNIEKLRFEPCTEVFKADWQQALAKAKALGRHYDLVFMDPPYRLLEIPNCCGRMADDGLLAQDAMLVLEHKTGVDITLDERFELYKEREYGETQIHFYLYQPDLEEQR